MVARSCHALTECHVTLPSRTAPAASEHFPPVRQSGYSGGQHDFLSEQQISPRPAQQPQPVPIGQHVSPEAQRERVTKRVSFQLRELC